MSNEIPLQVIYSKLEPSQLSYSAVHPSSSYQAVVAEEAPKKKKTTKSLHPCAKIFLCMTSFFLITSLILTMIGTVHWYYSLKGCFASDHLEIEELITDISNIQQINFDLVTAGIVFSTHDDDKLVVKFYHSARESHLLDEMIGGMTIVDNVLYIKDETPAFDFNTCQYTYVEVLLPSDISLQYQQELSITGTVEVGYVGSYFLSNLGNVNVNVQVGFVDLEIVNARSVAASAGLGLIFAENVWAEDEVRFDVGTGSIRTQSISSKVFEARAFYGTSWNVEVEADQANVRTEFGYASLLRPTHFTSSTNQEVNIASHYGKAIATYDQFYNVHFNLISGFGRVNVDYSDKCKFIEGPSSALGVCSFDAMEPITTINLAVEHGRGIFVQSSPDFEALEDIVDSPSYQVDVEVAEV